MKRILRFALFGFIGLCLFVTIIGAIANRNRSSVTPTATALVQPTQQQTEQPKPTETSKPTNTSPSATKTPPLPTATPATVKEHLEQIGHDVCKDAFIKADYAHLGNPPTIAIFECQPVDNLTEALIIGTALMRLQELGEQAFTITEVDVVRIIMPQQFNFTAPRALASLMVPKDGVKRKEIARSLEANKSNFSLFVRPYSEAWTEYVKG